MQVEIRTFSTHPARVHRAYVRKRLRFKCDSHPGMIRRLKVHLMEQNAAKPIRRNSSTRRTKQQFRAFPQVAMYADTSHVRCLKDFVVLRQSSPAECPPVS